MRASSLIASSLALIATLLPTQAHAASAWEDESGLTQLRSELGSSTPTGEGVRVSMAEAPVGGGYYPQSGGPDNFAGTGADNYLGITFLPQSGAQAYSSHAAGVASRFFDRSSGIAPGITEVLLFTANDYLVWAQNNAAGNPIVDTGRVHNSSWIGAAQETADNITLINALDASAINQGALHCVGINNSTVSVPILNTHGYNNLSVGKKDGNHSYGTTGADYPGPGRMKPDLTGASTTSSNTTPEVAGCAALLFETVDKNSSLSNANDPNVIRAILLTGASKSGLPQWNRADQSKPYDTVFGAGQVNVYNSYHVLTGGEQPPSETTPAALKGWAKPNSVATQQFLIRIPEGSYADELAITLSWFRRQDGRDTGTGTSERDDLHVILYSRDTQGTLTEIDRCQSPVDNVQHIFRRNLEPGDYLIEVPEVSYTLRRRTRGFEYALAWRAELGAGPQQSTTAGQPGTINFSNLDPAAGYTVERSTSLESPSWTTVGSLPAGERFSATFTDPAPPTDRAFYRIRWTQPTTPAAP
ncbi:hypothetical protein [Sulfuriroseicoccus oceanibius]|uniref:Peptidase S8/S53 domain-containing protein n=1 Tax=Sulfuriroseicoccus oceanibius TaxID=2707525 RepID=A0A6B3LCM0_9BACT|nr:hypothetical protein [Sulfuriroseicoccus oceanibius]QQL45787.1 hypothetical protein G3M56_004165 [Sulfuriroseicoccus oceanibius]